MFSPLRTFVVIIILGVALITGLKLSSKLDNFIKADVVEITNFKELPSYRRRSSRYEISFVFVTEGGEKISGRTIESKRMLYSAPDPYSYDSTYWIYAIYYNPADPRDFVIRDNPVIALVVGLVVLLAISVPLISIAIVARYKS
jgi:hypothetical protein